MKKFYLLNGHLVVEEKSLFSLIERIKENKTKPTIVDCILANSIKDAADKLFFKWGSPIFGEDLNPLVTIGFNKEEMDDYQRKICLQFTPNKQLKHNSDNKPQEVKTEKLDERSEASAFSTTGLNMKGIYKDIEDKLNQYNKQYSITKEEIDFYVNAHSIKIPESDELGNIRIDNLQMQLIMIYFKDKGINVRMVRKRDYINLMIILKRILLFEDMVFLPYVISGVVDIYEQKEIDKEAIELLLVSFANRELNDFVKKYLFKLLCKKINIVDMNEDINNKLIDIKLPEMLYDELLIFLLLISENK